MKFSLIWFMLFLCCMKSLLAAGSWEEMFRALIDEQTGDQVIESGKVYTGSLYSANVRFQIINGDNNTNNFSNADSIEFEIIGTDLKFTGSKKDFIQYAESKGSKLYDAIFPNDPNTLPTTQRYNEYSNLLFLLYIQ